VDGSEASCLAGSVGQLLVEEHNEANDDDAGEHHDEERHDQGEFNEGLTASGGLVHRASPYEVSH
jgi:hypothetical protein